MAIDESAARCSYTLQPSRWNEERDAECLLTADDLDDEGVWRCPHQSREDRRYCPFHQPPEETDDDAVAEAFRRAVAGERATTGSPNAAKQFIGATFGDLSLEYAILDGGDRRPIDLRHVRVAGDLIWRAAQIRNPLRAAGMVVEGEAECRNAAFEDAVSFAEASFGGDAAFSRATFEGEAGFGDATFGATAAFRQTTFRDDASFNEATFVDNVKFTTASFEGDAHFRAATFGGYGWFDGATFGDDAQFSSGTTFKGKAWFDGATFESEARFRNTTFGSVARFEGATFVDAGFRPTGEGSAVRRINLRESSVDTGSLDQGDAPTVYDLTAATVGDVDVNASTNPFEHVEISEATFEGFDFSRRQYRDALEATGWRLHTTVEGASEPGESFFPDDPEAALSRYSEREITYLKAKNGANRVGYDKAAAEFFRRQMINRRRTYWCQALDTGSDGPQRLKAAGQWLANLLFGTTAGHGERPSRVIGTSVAVVLAFTALYAVLWSGDLPYGHPAGFLLLSIESFVTLVLGGAAEIRDPWWLRLLAEIEGFVGVFLVALFVFALTRSIER